MEKENKTSENQYRSMAKGTAMMGGVQVFNIFINLVRGKLVAMFLGPQGMGVMSLLQSSGNMIQQLSSVGLHLSVVKEVADPNSDRNHLVAVVRRLLLITALFGVIITIVFSSGLSRFSFGNTNYVWHYILLSLMIFFMTLGNGEMAMLQGAHSLKRLAYASLVGSCTGLLIGVPLFYVFGENGIVPSLIVSSLALFVFYKYQAAKTFGRISTKGVHLKKEISLIKKLVSLGFIFMLSSLLGTITTYLINYFIRLLGTVEDVGLFQAANSLTNQYAGLVFAAMSMDFFPRLSNVSSDDSQVRKLVNNQMEIVVLIVAPIVSLIILFAPLIITILLTEDFLSIVSVVKVMAVGIFFKAISYPMGYISFSKGDKKTFFWLEGVCGNILHLVLSVVFYKLFGVIGLGVAFGAGFFIYIFIYMIVTRRLYNFWPSRDVLLLLFPLLVGVLGLFACSFISNALCSYITMTIAALFLSLFSFVQLNRRLDIKELVLKRIHRK